MEAKELRVGNLITKTTGTVIQVFEILEQSVNGKYPPINENRKMYNFQISDLRGIHLTPNWLLQLGFEQDGNNYISPQPTDEYKLRFKFNGKIIKHSMNFFTDRELNFVHQLQNLYYALTGEELAIV